MKRRTRRNPLTGTMSGQAPQPPMNVMELEELALYVRRAEQIMLPIIKELKPGPAETQFLLAQFLQVLSTGTDALTPESARSITDAVQALWEAGYYTPGPDYPFTLTETLQERTEGLAVKQTFTQTVDNKEQHDAGGESSGSARVHDLALF